MIAKCQTPEFDFSFHIAKCFVLNFDFSRAACRMVSGIAGLSGNPANI